MQLAAYPSVLPRGRRAVRLWGPPHERRNRVASFVAAAKAAADAAFGRCKGATVRLVHREPDRAYRIEIARGELQANLCVFVEPGRDGGSERLWYWVEGGPRSLARWEAERSQAITLAQRVGRGVGAASFLAMCWLAVGVHAPVFVLGGLLMVVVMLVAVLGGGTAGEWIAERLATVRLARLRARLATDGILRADLRRLEEFTRALARIRRELERTDRGGPFRSASLGSSGAYEAT